MNRLKLLALVGLMAVALLTPGSGMSADDKKGSADKHGSHFMDCAKACDDCARICDACAAHCAKMLADGKKDHLQTLRTCADCASFCSAASCITARQGPFSDLICTGCADACKRCGDACTKFKDDEMMKKCADECYRCEKACRTMVKMADHSGKTK